MNRRGFFKLFGAGVVGIALSQAIPLGRVWSFPSEIIIAPPLTLLEAQIEALELEAFAERIPDLVYHQNTVYKMFKERSLIKLSA